ENAMARVVRFHKTGGPEGLKVEQLDVPRPGKGEVQISVKALGLNRAESMFRRGEYIEQPDFPARIGYEAAGTVAAVGPGGEGIQVGDAVSTIPAFSMNHYGVYGDLVSAPVHAVAHHPAALSWEQAASIWMQYLTGSGALIDIAGLKAGDTLVIPAASSSVRPGRHPDRQPGGCDSHRPDPQELEEAGPDGRGRDPRRRDRRTGPGQGNPRP